MKGNERKAECKSEKTYCKFVGARLRTCPLQKGITLIALIITIIVMLILVGVTINIALNGELFTAAQKATGETQIEADREQLLSAVVGAIGKDATVDFSKLDSNLPNEWTKLTDKTYKSPKGNVFTVDEKGNITDESENGGTSEEDNTVPDELAKYILGADGEGRLIDSIIDGDNLIFKQDPADLESTIHENVKISHTEESGECVYIRYGRDVYKFKIELTEEENLNTAKGSLEKVNTPEGNLGKYATYQGKTWIVLYDDSEKVELISADALGNVALSGSTFENGKESYNNAIETLTQACKETTGITTGIRNVGGPVEDPETPTYVTLNDLKTKGFVPQSDKEAQIGTLIADIKQGDENYLNDYNQMKALGILLTDTQESYWLASRFVYVDSDRITLKVRYISLEDDILNDYNLWDVNANGSDYGAIYGGTIAVRPVVSLSAGTLDGKSGEGTRNNPINLD